MAQDKLIIRGAREHNLKDIDVVIPRDHLVVITGISGSGKSSLAFDTIYAEGQRRYVESLSAYARQFLGQMDKPDVDQIEGLSPAIAIDQKGGSHNPRSTVGTVTEIYDYLRLLFARIGVPHCPFCGQVVARQTVDQIADSIMALPDGLRILILAPLVRDRKGAHERVLEDVRKAGFVRVRVDGRVYDVTEQLELDRKRGHSIEAVVDRVVVRRGDDGLDRTRLTDSVETALELGDGVLVVSPVYDARSTTRDEGSTSQQGDRIDSAPLSAEAPEQSNPIDSRTGSDILFSERFACPECGVSFPEIEPRSFSFNSPHGACPRCQGLGVQRQIDPALVVPNPELSLREGAVAPWSKSRNEEGYYMQLLSSAAEAFGFDMRTAWGKLDEDVQRIVLEGSDDTRIDVRYRTRHGYRRNYRTRFEGVIPNLARRYESTDSDYVRSEIEKYMTSRACPACRGTRLRPESAAVQVAGHTIADVSRMPIGGLLDWVTGLRSDGDLAGELEGDLGEIQAGGASANARLSDRDLMIGGEILREIGSRLQFLVDVGLDYLTLDRRARSLAGGEAQRIRLATQIGSRLMGVLYILDEPSIGLHQRDNARLIRSLLGLRDLGNTVLVVEHDEESIRSADWVIDLGPGAGEHGGKVVAEGPVEAIEANSESLTGMYLTGTRKIPIPVTRRKGSGAQLKVIGAAANNLDSIDVEIPLGTLTVVTGVSGSGKSTLVLDVLYARLAQLLHDARSPVGAHRRVEGYEHIDKVIDIDQSPIGRTPRSNPATYTNVFTPIRDLFSSLPDAKVRGYKPGRFSFNVKGGRCEACHGDGILKIEMQFLPDVYVPCEVCNGARYNRETLQIRFKGKSIADVLALTVSEAVEFFGAFQPIKRKLETLEAVGLGYLTLGQPAPTLSGGEAQRVKLSRELSRVATGSTLYILDEPTTGLHFADVEKLLTVLQALVDSGNTVLVIEHNLEIIKSADWIIDLGPEGGEGGGQVVAVGTPEEIADVPSSHTGAFLAKVLAGEWTPEPVIPERA